jgi:hypothetical protein
MSYDELLRRYQALQESTIHADERAKEISDENAELRTMLALAHAGASLYTDDGELQDGRAYPIIDFRRDAVAVIKQKLLERAIGPFGPPTGGEG